VVCADLQRRWRDPHYRPIRGVSLCGRRTQRSSTCCGQHDHVWAKRSIFRANAHHCRRAAWNVIFRSALCVGFDLRQHTTASLMARRHIRDIRAVRNHCRILFKPRKPVRNGIIFHPRPGSRAGHSCPVLAGRGLAGGRRHAAGEAGCLSGAAHSGERQGQMLQAGPREARFFGQICHEAMKCVASFALGILLLVAPRAGAQGTIVMSNYGTSPDGQRWSAPIYNTDGVTPATSPYEVALYVGGPPQTVQLVPGSTTLLGPGGLFSGPALTVPGEPVNAVVFAVIHAWNSTYGSTLQQAAVNGSLVGETTAFITTFGFASSPGTISSLPTKSESRRLGFLSGSML